jgi:hypothetical protein
VSYGLGIGLSVFFARRYISVPFVSWLEALKGCMGCLVMFWVIEWMALPPTVGGLALGVSSGILVYFMMMGLMNLGAVRKGMIERHRRKTACEG